MGIAVMVIGILLLFVGYLYISHMALLIYASIGIVLIGGIMSFVGQILGLIVGSFRLKEYFKESGFGTAGIMFIIGIFISPFNFIGSILMFLATRKALQNISTT